MDVKSVFLTTIKAAIDVMESLHVSHDLFLGGIIEAQSVLQERVTMAYEEVRLSETEGKERFRR